MLKDEDIFKLRIKEIMRQKGISGKELAARMGKAPQYISNVINGSGLSVNVLIEFARVLDVEFRDLFEPMRPAPPSEVCPYCGRPIAVRLTRPD